MLPPGAAFAVIRPQAIALRARSLAGFERPQHVARDGRATIDRLGDRVRIGIDGILPLTAEITAAALDALQLRPGRRDLPSVKATDIEVYPCVLNQCDLTDLLMREGCDHGGWDRTPEEQAPARGVGVPRASCTRHRRTGSRSPPG